MTHGFYSSIYHHPMVWLMIITALLKCCWRTTLPIIPSRDPPITHQSTSRRAQQQLMKTPMKAVSFWYSLRTLQKCSFNVCIVKDCKLLVLYCSVISDTVHHWMSSSIILMKEVRSQKFIVLCCASQLVCLVFTSENSYRENKGKRVTARNRCLLRP